MRLHMVDSTTRGPCFPNLYNSTNQVENVSKKGLGASVKRRRQGRSGVWLLRWGEELGVGASLCWAGVRKSGSGGNIGIAVHRETAVL